jgi:hypothetical protein
MSVRASVDTCPRAISVAPRQLPMRIDHDTGATSGSAAPSSRTATDAQLDARLDEALDESFPASDPPAVHLAEEAARKDGRP